MHLQRYSFCSQWVYCTQTSTVHMVVLFFILYFVSRSSPHWQSFKVSKVHSLTLLQSLSLDFICRLQWKLLLFRRSLFASCLWHSGDPDWQWVTRVTDHHVKSHLDEVMLCSSIPVRRVWRWHVPIPCKWREINLAEPMPTVENRVEGEKKKKSLSRGRS